MAWYKLYICLWWHYYYYYIYKNNDDNNYVGIELCFPSKDLEESPSTYMAKEMLKPLYIYSFKNKRINKHTWHVPNSQVEQKGRTVQYVRAYLEGDKEEGGRRSANWLSHRRRRKRDRRETERERGNWFWVQGHSQNAAFQVRVFTSFSFFLSSPCPGLVRHGRGRQIAVSVSVSMLSWI